jgi:hypothetical protein
MKNSEYKYFTHINIIKNAVCPSDEMSAFSFKGFLHLIQRLCVT